MTGRPGFRVAVRRSRGPTTGTVVRRAQGERLGRVHRRSAADRDDDRVRRARRPAARRRRAPRWRRPGWARRRRRARSSRPAAVEDAEDMVDDAGGDDARVGHDEDARRADRRDQLGERLDRADPEADPVAQGQLESADRRATDIVSAPRGRGRRWCRGGRSASAGSRTRGTSARSSRRRGCRRSRPRRSRARRVRDGRRRGPPLAAEDELVERAAPAARAVEPEHQRVPAEPASARTWSRAEPLERERRDERRRPARGDQLGHPLAAGRDGLEAPRAPAGRDVEAVDRRSRS